MTIERKPAKPKKCRVATCRASFVPSRMGQAVCSPACAMIDGPRHAPKARKALDQIERAEIKVRKEKLKSRADHAKEAQAVINRYVRLRDALWAAPAATSRRAGAVNGTARISAVSAPPHISVSTSGT